MIKRLNWHNFIILYNHKKKIYKPNKVKPLLSILFDDYEDLIIEYEMDDLITGEAFPRCLKDFAERMSIKIEQIENEILKILSYGTNEDLYFPWPEMLIDVLKIFFTTEDIDRIQKSSDFENALDSYLNVAIENIFYKKHLNRYARTYLKYFDYQTYQIGEICNFASQALVKIRMIEIDRYFAWMEKYSSQKMRIKYSLPLATICTHFIEHPQETNSADLMVVKYFLDRLDDVSRTQVKNFSEMVNNNHTIVFVPNEANFFVLENDEKTKNDDEKDFRRKSEILFYALKNEIGR